MEYKIPCGICLSLFGLFHLKEMSLNSLIIQEIGQGRNWSFKNISLFLICLENQVFPYMSPMLCNWNCGQGLGLEATSFSENKGIVELGQKEKHF